MLRTWSLLLLAQVKDQIDRLAQMEWSRKTGFVKTVVAKRSSPTEKLQAAGEVPPQVRKAPFCFRASAKFDCWLANAPAQSRTYFFGFLDYAVQFVIAFDKLMNFPLSPAGHVIMISVGPHSLLKQAGVQAGDFILKVRIHVVLECPVHCSFATHPVLLCVTWCGLS